MSLTASAIEAVERIGLPDPVMKLGMDLLIERTRRRLSASPGTAEAAFVDRMTTAAIAEHAAVANQQHYELPPAFFELVLGPRRKYSCCLYQVGDSLAMAEERALLETASHADLSDGQRILELGCGWGSLTLFMAEHFPNSRITAVSNSVAQRQFIERAARARGLGNVSVLTADMNGFEADTTFDRIVSVEMFEHMANWRVLLGRIHRWLAPDGRLFVHVFAHRDRSYQFDHRDAADWIARHFFTGGIMPSRSLIHRTAERFSVEQEWHWNGLHYRHTALDWLRNFDAHRPEIDALLRSVYGKDARLWRRRWRMFFLATAQLFGADGGAAWGVSHYRLRLRPPAANG